MERCGLTCKIKSLVTSINHKNSSNTLISGETYTYDDASNLSTKVEGSVTTTYTYDNADQLTEESRTGFDAVYTYDANGNRASKTYNGGTSEIYTNDDGDKLTSITQGGTTIKSFGYDAAGRTTSVVTSAGTTTLAYDYESRITQITYPGGTTNTQYTYNGLDARMTKTNSGSATTTYKRGGASVLSPVMGDGTRTYVPGISSFVGTTPTYDHHDRMGTAQLQTNSSQTNAGKRSYDAFGVAVSTSGTPVTMFGYAGGYGYQQDDESGLKLLGHRYYDPSIGRFLTRDFAKNGRNWFSYCEQIPTGSVDPSGYITLSQGIALGVSRSISKWGRYNRNGYFLLLWDGSKGAPGRAGMIDFGPVPGSSGPVWHFNADKGPLAVFDHQEMPSIGKWLHETELGPRLGKSLVPIALTADVIGIGLAEPDDKLPLALEDLFSWGGAWYGSEVGSEFGLPGTIGGGIIGGFAGGPFGKAVYDLGSDFADEWSLGGPPIGRFR